MRKMFKIVKIIRTDEELTYDEFQKIILTGEFFNCEKCNYWFNRNDMYGEKNHMKQCVPCYASYKREKKRLEGERGLAKKMHLKVSKLWDEVDE